MIEWDLLRLEGYASTTSEEIDGVLYVDAELTDVSVPACGCESPDVVKHGKMVVNFRDHPNQRQETYLRITMQRYRCRACKAILLEALPGIDPGRLNAERKSANAGKQIKDAKLLHHHVPHTSPTNRAAAIATMIAMTMRPGRSDASGSCQDSRWSERKGSIMRRALRQTKLAEPVPDLAAR